HFSQGQYHYLSVGAILAQEPAELAGASGMQLGAQTVPHAPGPVALGIRRVGVLLRAASLVQAVALVRQPAASATVVVHLDGLAGSMAAQLEREPAELATSIASVQ